MKKNLIYLICLVLLSVNALYSQQQKFTGKSVVPLKNPEFNKPVKLLPASTGEEIIPVKRPALPARHGGNNSVTGLWSIIGNTTYDLQSNGSTLNSIYNDGNNIGSVFSFSSDLTGSYPDRGTGYNFSNDNGVNWMTPPVARVEPDRRGWPNIDKLGSGECFVSHKGGDSLGFYFRPVQGTGSWTKTGLVPPDALNFNYPLWPRMKVAGAAGNTVHVVSLTTPIANGAIALFNGIDGAMIYSRSQDGGNTWNINNSLLPGIDSLHYSGMRADNYAIDAKGNTVAIVHGGLTNDWILWKSVDDGTTWTRTVIKEFPIPAYDQATMTTDTNSDGIADTLEAVDGIVSVLIDNTGMVHCWSGRSFVIQDSITPAVNYFPYTDGLYYWNESYFSSPPVILASVLDLDSSGTLEIGFSMAIYGGCMTSMPTAGIDANSNIFLAYSSIVENTDNGADQNYRNIYCMVSPDNGNSWSQPVNLSNSDFDEAVFPSMAREVDANVHIQWMQDAEPGLSGISFDNDPITVNDIVYDLEDTTGIFQGISPSPHFQNHITGTVFYDLNQNGIMDGVDFGMPGQKLRILPDSTIKFTNSNGDYDFRVDTGSYTVEYLPDPAWQITSDSATYTVYTDTILIVFSNRDFGAIGTSAIYDLTTSLTSSQPRCTSDVNYWINYTNTGTAVIDTGIVTFVKDPLMTFVQSTPPYNTASGDTFTWIFTNLLPFHQGQINMLLHIGPPLAQGDTIHNCAAIYYNDGSTLRTSNDCLTQIITCSLDPNDKSADPEGLGIQHLTLLSDTLQYTIRFQNTGTDTAFTVRIKDTLDAALDINTFRVVAASHAVQTTLESNGALEFFFDNILLADSNVNEPASHGFVKYLIKAKAGTPSSTPVQNTAYIYFDFNPPVTTNTTLNTLVTTISVNETASPEIKSKIYPNPFTESAILIFENEKKEKFSLEVVDMTGRKLQQAENIITGRITLKKGTLAHGIYLYRLIDAHGKNACRGKMIIE
ncbi:MAG TPA: T9SS type A sorting domain-containing protein [Bacteroidia bacterium]|nr:T9SS type A sorting domain-containing protein [Bacteroidia bacterium]